MNDWLRASRLIPKPKRAPSRTADLVFWDTETDPIVIGCRVPSPRIACTSDLSGTVQRTYHPKDFAKLARDLAKADWAVSFNGLAFDVAVVARQLKRSARELKVRTYDLMREIEKVTGTRHNLNNLAYVNFTEPKRQLGFSPGRTTAELEKDCRSDTDQLRRLFLLFRDGQLKVPVFSEHFTKRKFRAMPFGGQCPVCNDIASINELPPGTSDDQDWDALMMSAVFPHEEAERLLGIERNCRCFSCGTIFVSK